ncbi:hypothetical protein P9112_006109 [Eukaryota sp. TZLM1-RC]
MGATIDLLLSGNDLRLLKVHASEDTKIRAVYTLVFLEKTQQDVAEYYCVAQSTVSTWLRQVFPSSESTPNPTSRNLFQTPSSRHKLNETESSFILQLVKEQPLLFLREIGKLVFTKFRKKVSVTTVHRLLIKNNFTHKKCANLMRRAKKELIHNFELSFRRLFGVVIQQQLLFIDEVSFKSEHFVRKTCWSPKGVPINTERPNFKEGQVSLMVAIVNGLVMFHIKQGHFNRTGYVSFLQDLLHHKLLSIEGGARSIVVVDGCNIHKNAYIFRAVKLAGLKYLILPPYSPDCNPIEAFFGLLRRKVRDNSLHSPLQGVNLLQQLLRTMIFNCSNLFDHSGWEDFCPFRSPYLHGIKANFFKDHLD